MMKRVFSLVLAFVLVLALCLPVTAKIITGTDDYQDHIAEFPNMSVDAVTVESVTVTTLPEQLNYRVGDAFNANGMVVHVVYSDGYEADLTTSFSVKGFYSSTPGIKKVSAVVGNQESEPFRVFVGSVPEEIEPETGLKWSLRYLDESGNPVTAVPEGGTFWVSVSLKNYESVVGEASMADSGPSPRILDHMLDAYLTVLHYDSDKIVPVVGTDPVSVYADMGMTGDGYDSNGRYVYMAAAGANPVGGSDLTANGGELFRVKFENISSELDDEATVGFVAFDGSSCQVTFVDKVAGADLDINSLTHEDVGGYDVVYPLTLGVSPALKISGATLSLQSNIAIDAYVKKSLIDGGVYTDPVLHFSMNERQLEVTKYHEEGNYYCFRFSDISPDQMSDVLSARLVMKDGDGKEVFGPILSYSIATYCRNTLTRYTGAEYAAFRTLVVDLLRYGDASQVYNHHNADAPVSALLTDEEAACGTPTDTEVVTTDHMSTTYQTVDQALVYWEGAQLSLNDGVDIQFILSAADMTGLTFKICDDSGVLATYTSGALRDSGYADYKLLVFNGLDAGQMRTEVYVTAYQGDNAVSNTLRYSIESYANSKLKKQDTPEDLRNLLNAMIRYGDSAAVFDARS